MDYTPQTWVDDDGSGTVGTLYTAARMNNLETALDALAEHSPNLIMVRLATNAALPANTRTGNVITAEANGALTVDGTAAAEGNIILVKNEATASKNGPFVVTNPGAAGAKFVLTRLGVKDSSTEVVPNELVAVALGVANSGTIWRLSNTSVSINSTFLTYQRAFPPQNLIFHDAQSNPTAGTGNLEWTHTPGAGNPRGVLVLIAQDATSADQITTVTYGGVAMAEVALSPVLHAKGSEDATIYGYFLGRGVPVGAQTVVVTVSGAASKQALCVSMLAPGDLRVEDTTLLDSEETVLPVVSLTTATGTETIVYGVLHSGQESPGGIGVGGTQPTIASHDFGTAVAVWSRLLANPTGGTAKLEWTSSNEEAGALGVAIGLVRDFGIVTALPSVAGIGDTCKYQVSTGIIWNLVYTGEATYPWTKVGGPPMREMDEGGSRETSSSTFQTTGAPSITAPLAMEFRARSGADGQAQLNAAGPGTMNTAVFIDGVEQASTNAYVIGQATFDSAPIDVRSKTLTVAAGKAVQTRYRNESSKASKFLRLFIEVDPLRVG